MIKLTKSTFYKPGSTVSSLSDFIKSGFNLSMGSECKKFEENFSNWQGRSYSVFVNSGSSANLVLLQALMNCGRLHQGDTVGVSALTWATNVMPIIQLGLKPVLFDCNLKTLNVGPNDFEGYFRTNMKPKCLFITNSLGFADRIDLIADICKAEGIILLEDNCNDPPVFAQVRLLFSMIDRFVPVFSCPRLDEAGVGYKTQSSH